MPLREEAGWNAKGLLVASCVTDWTEVTVTVAVALQVGFALAVAVTVTAPAATGAVKRPCGVMEPAETDQDTVVMEEPVTDAEKLWLPPAGRLTVAGLTDTLI